MKIQLEIRRQTFQNPPFRIQLEPIFFNELIETFDIS